MEVGKRERSSTRYFRTMSSLMEAENIHQDKENFQRVPSSRKTRRRGLAIREESIQNVHVLDGAGKEKADTGAPVTLECDFLESYLKPMTFFLMNGLSASLQKYVSILIILYVATKIEPLSKSKSIIAGFRKQ